MSRQRWIDAGMSVLAEDGIAGVRIDRLVPRVGLSKGSFFHHFENAAAFRTAVLQEWRSRSVEAVASPTTSDLANLADRVDELLDVQLESAMRAWASHDVEAADVVAEVDRARLTMLEAVWRDTLGDPRQARIAALVPHLIVIGATVARPTVDDADMRDVFGLLAELIPAVANRPH